MPRPRGAPDGSTRCSAPTSAARSRAAWIASISSTGTVSPSTQVWISQNHGYSALGRPCATGTGIATGSAGASLGSQSSSLLPGAVGPRRRGSRTDSSSPSRKIALTVPPGWIRRSGSSARSGNCSARAYADVREGEAWLVGSHIPVYERGNLANHDPDRDRKLLLHRKQIASLYGSIRERGLTLVPTRLYFKDGRVKVELALARGKETRDKRRDIARRDADRQIERALKSRR